MLADNPKSYIRLFFNRLFSRLLLQSHPLLRPEFARYNYFFGTTERWPSGGVGEMRRRESSTFFVKYYTTRIIPIISQLFANLLIFPGYPIPRLLQYRWPSSYVHIHAAR